MLLASKFNGCIHNAFLTTMNMNSKVQELIDTERQRLISAKKQDRDNLLISLGLIDEEKTILKEYVHYDPQFPSRKFDEVKKVYYQEIPAPLSITDDEYEELSRYFPEDNKTSNGSTSEEGTLNAIAVITLILGLICSLILFFTLALESDRWGTEFKMTGFVIALSVMLYTIMTWALLRVISNISINIRQLNNKTK
jgi:hypothetical protein